MNARTVFKKEKSSFQPGSEPSSISSKYGATLDAVHQKWHYTVLFSTRRLKNYEHKFPKGMDEAI